MVTLYNNAAGWSQTRVRTTGGAWALLAAFFGGDVLVDGTVVADKLAVNSVTANAIAAGAVSSIHLQAGSILASKLTVTDFANLVPDPRFEELGVTWTLHASAVSTIPVSPTYWNTTTLIRIMDSVARASNSLPIPVVPGEQFYFQFYARVVAGTGTIYGQVQFSETADFAVIASSTSVAITSTSATLGSAMVTVPVGAVFARIRFVTSTGVTNAYFGAPVLRRAASGELIVDGAVVASKIAAGAVSADKIEAGSILASKLAISDFSNIVPDGEMADPAAWTLLTGWSRNPGATSFGFESPNSLMFTDD
ncbi:hypothetical protein, partial [Ruixingdingia sedimenti]